MNMYTDNVFLGVNLSGKKYGRITISGFAGRRRPAPVKYPSKPQTGSSFYWHGICDCGKNVTVLGKHLFSGKTRSCGCFKSESEKLRIKHGFAIKRPRVYRIWSGLFVRCYNAKASHYEMYGGRGIKVCDRWREFKNFYDDMGDPPLGTSIERIDNNGNYEPSNCRWATQQEQMNNTRINRFITFRGRTKTLSEWSRITGLKYYTISRWIKSGKPIEEVLREQ